MKKLSSVIYHYVKRDDKFSRIYGHDFELFKEHVEFYRKNFKIISVEDLLNNNFSCGKNILLSFDDGLKEHHDVFAEYLNKYNIKALFNISTCVLRGEPINPQIIHFVTAYYGVRKFCEFVRDEIRLNFKKYLKLLPEDDKDIEIYELYGLYKKLFRKELDYYSARKILILIYEKKILEKFPNFMDTVYMSKNNIENLVNNGHYIGVHTNTHFPIGLVGNDKEIMKEEIIKPKKYLENLIQKDIKVFSYPFGQQGDIVENYNIWKKYGFELVFTTFKRENDKYNKLNIGRYSSQSRDSIKDLRNKIWNYEIGNINK